MRRIHLALGLPFTVLLGLVSCDGGGETAGTSSTTTGSGGAASSSSTSGSGSTSTSSTSSGSSSTSSSSSSTGSATGGAGGGAPKCGDGHVDPGEVCDDGNTDEFDACRSDCTPGPCADPKALGSLAHRCSTLPLLLDPGYGTLGLLPYERLPGTWNPYIWDGNADASTRTDIYARAASFGLGEYWLLYGYVFEGLDPYRLERGKVPQGTDPHGAPLVDECGVASDTGGSQSACLSQLNACGMVVGGQDPTALTNAYAAWVADTPLGEHQAENRQRSAPQPGLLPDTIAPPSIDLAQIDMEGSCFGQLISRTPDAAQIPAAREVLGRAHDGLRQAFDSGQIGTGSGPQTELGLYGLPFPQLFADAKANGQITLPALVTDGTLGGYGDDCRFFAPQIAYEKCGAGQMCDPHVIRFSHLGIGYAPVGQLLPWMYLTGKAPNEHPAFTWLPATSDATPATYEAPDVVQWANVPQNGAAFFAHYFAGTSANTSMPGANSAMDQLPGTVQYPSLYQAGSRLQLAWGDATRNAWNRNRVGDGAPVFAHQIVAPNDPHFGPVYDYLLESELESARLANHAALEVAWAWKLWKGQRIAPIVTVIPGIVAFNEVRRDPTTNGNTLCTSDTSTPGVDEVTFPSRCGALPTACTVGGMNGARIDDVPVHPGRKLQYQLWNEAMGQYVPDTSNTQVNVYVASGSELYFHQTRAEFERTQVLPMIQAVPKGQIDAVVAWPDAGYLVSLCASQGRRLARGGGFTIRTMSGSRENGGVPEPLWMQFFTPGPLDRWCHLPGNEASCNPVLAPAAACTASDVCEPKWAAMPDQHGIEELCTDAVDGYVLDRWQWIREAFETAHGPNPPPTHQRQPSPFCTWLEGWMTTHLQSPPPSPLCQ